jgi:hypothetical protein
MTCSSQQTEKVDESPTGDCRTRLQALAKILGFQSRERLTDAVSPSPRRTIEPAGRTKVSPAARLGKPLERCDLVARSSLQILSSNGFTTCDPVEPSFRFLQNLVAFLEVSPTRKYLRILKWAISPATCGR